MQSAAIRPIANMLARNLFTAEHEAFRETVRKFYEKEVAPNMKNMSSNSMLTVSYGIKRCKGSRPCQNMAVRVTVFTA